MAIRTFTNSQVILQMKYLFLVITSFIWLTFTSCSSDIVKVNPREVKIILAENEPSPLRLAVETLTGDFEKVMGAKPIIVSELSDSNNPAIVIVNRETNALNLPLDKLRPLDSFESHRVWLDEKSNRIYLDGKDMRGAIYAVYTFAEKFLEVPPLWFWSTWEPQYKDILKIPKTTDIFFKSPQVRYRSWLPNDADLYGSWIRQSEENSNIVYETMLRLKLNTMEDAGLAYPGIGRGMQKCKKFGLVVTSHHMFMLNTTFSNWKRYWKNVRKVDKVPQLSLANIDKLKELWEYGAQTVIESGVENIWNISFRGSGDQPFWILFPDAPESEEARAGIINEMLQEQVNIIKKYDKEKNPYIRITFYDEMADLVNRGLVRPPKGENMIWTFCSGRRDHYPYDDLQKFDPQSPVKLGYYLNLQFTSTGSHLAPAEGPWKMEFNYRYVHSKSPLYLSVVNSGNFREYMYTMTANAKLLWDYESFNCDKWNRQYAAQYFGEEHADEIAQLYKDYFYSYWTQRKPDFPGGMERQFIFQDQRYARAIGYISKDFFNFKEKPLPDRYMFERILGRVFRIIPEDNGVETQVDAILVGMETSAKKFDAVRERAEALMPQLESRYQQFFYDNLLAYTTFMAHLSHTLYYYTYAYKHQTDKAVLVENLKKAYAEMQSAQAALYKTQHGAFETWYSTDEKFDIPTVLATIKTTLDKAQNGN